MLAVVSKYTKGDKVIWMVILLLSILSLLAVYSSIGTLAYKFQQGNTVYYFIRHSVFLFIGLIIIFITHLIPYKLWSRLSQFFLIVSIPLLAITLLMGTNINEASRWLTLPGLGITMQTSDFAKLAIIMYIARMLSIKQENIKDFKQAFLPIIIPLAFVCILILPANFSTSAILFVTCFILMFIGRINLKYLFALAGIGILILSIFIIIILTTKTKSRVGVWSNRIESFTSSDKGGDNFQVDQAKIAIVSGGIFGKGPGNSIQRNYLPHPYSDFIYAIIIEEYGLIGGIVVLFLYLILLFRAGLIVRRSNRTFPAFLSIGLALMLVFQAMINMAVAVNLLPVTGQTLPLVSMGGTSMLFTGVSLGIILSVTREIESEQKEVKTNINEMDPDDPENNTEINRDEKLDNGTKKK